MNDNILFSIVATLISITQGTMTYGTPYNTYGNTDQGKPHYPEALVTYGPPQRAASRGRFYPPPQQRAYYPVQSKTYTPVQPGAYATPQQRTYRPPPQTRAYSYYAQPRRYTSSQQRSYPYAHPQPYTPAHPQVYSAARPHPIYSQAQPRVYTHPATTMTYAQRTPPGYFMPARPRVLKPVVRQPMRATVRTPVSTGIRQPINTGQTQPIRTTLTQSMSPVATQPISAFVKQPTTNALAPLTRTLAPKVPMFSPSYAARPVAPLGLGAYGRNRIPKMPARNNIPSRQSAEINPRIPQANWQQPYNKRTNIALNTQAIPHRPAQTPVERNYINGITIPTVNDNKQGPIKPQMNPTLANRQSLLQPIKPQVPHGHLAGQKLSTFLKSVKKLQDTLNGDKMRQELIYYKDDVSNKSHHRPTNFAPPTRKLGSLGSPGGSRVTFNEEPTVRPAIIPETRAVNQAGSERVKIAQIVANKNREDQKTTKISNQGDDHKTLVNKLLIKKTIVTEKPLPAITAGTDKLSTRITAGSTKSPHFAAAQVDLGLLKEKVLHSNNSQFLKRVLNVLKKYTKLMKSSMAGKNGTAVDGEGLQMNVLNASMAGNKPQIPNRKSAKKINEISKSNATNSESSVDFTNALNSTKTAVKIFDLLNSASKQNLKSSIVNELNRDSVLKNSTSIKNSESGTKTADIISSNKKTEQSLKDENASKKEIIEGEHNLGKPIFNLDKLKYGLERGNTID